MANEFKITDIVDPKVHKQLRDLNKDFETTGDKYAELANIIAGGIKFNPSDLESMDKKQKDYISTLKDLIATQNKLSSIQERQNKLIEDYGNKISKLLTLNTLPRQFDDLIKSINKVSNSLDDLSSKFEKSSTSQNSASQSNQQYTQSVQQTAQAISLTTKQYAEIINNVMAYDESAGRLNRNLAENKIQLSGIRKELAILSKEYQRGAISRDVYISKTDELTRKEQELSAQNKQYAALLRNHASVVVSTAGSYNEMSSAVLQLEKRFKDLAPALRSGDMGKGLLNQISSLKNELKSIDSQMGNYQRNVGNYSSHWNGLGMSVQQVARELPSLAMGWNTFFLAISNNLPSLSDELKKANAEFKAMQASGQKATPVWKQMAGAIFNWQTALVVGITLLSVYGKDIMNWVGNLFKAKNATLELISAENQMALARKSAMESSVKERTELDLLYNKLKDTTISTKERSSAANEWVKKYPKYSNVINGESVDVGKLSLAYGSLKKEIINSAIAKSYMDKVSELGLQKDKEEIKRLNQKKTVLEAENKVRGMSLFYIKAKAKYEETGSLKDKEIRNNALGALTRYKNELVKQKDIYSILEKNIKNLDDQTQVFFNHIDSSSIYKNAAKGTEEYWSNMRNQAGLTLKSIKSDTLELLNAGNFEGIDQSIVDTYKNAQKQLAEANKNLSVYNGIDTTNKQAEKEAKEKLKLQEQIQESELSLRDEGLKKELAKISLGYTKKMAALKGGGKEEIAARNAIGKEMQQALDDYTIKYNSDREKKDIENALSVVKQGSKEELDLKLRQLDLQREAEIDAAEKTGEDVFLIDEKYNEKRKELNEKFADEQNKAIQKGYAGRSVIVMQEVENELSALTDSYTQGIIDKETYEEEKLRITEKYAIEQAQLAIELAKAQLLTADLSPDDRLDLEKKLAEAEIALAEKVRDAQVKAAEDTAKGKGRSSKSRGRYR